MSTAGELSSPLKLFPECPFKQASHMKEFHVGRRYHFSVLFLWSGLKKRWDEELCAIADTWTARNTGKRDYAMTILKLPSR